MTLTDKHIEEFRVLYQQCFGIEISKEEAQEQGLKLLRLMELTYKPLRKTELVAVEERQHILRE